MSQVADELSEVKNEINFTAKLEKKSEIYADENSDSYALDIAFFNGGIYAKEAIILEVSNWLMAYTSLDVEKIVNLKAFFENK